MRRLPTQYTPLRVMPEPPVDVRLRTRIGVRYSHLGMMHDFGVVRDNVVQAV